MSIQAMADAKTTVKDLKNLVEKFVHERKWEPYHQPKNLAASISIEAAELLEIFQWEDLDKADVRTNKLLMSQIKDEAADIMVYILALSNSLQFDLSDAIAKKMEANKKKYKA
jgi:dCTP diphosphatase